MSVEDKVREHLQQGNTPAQLVRQGYRKSTVYKVYNTVKGNWLPVSKPEWQVTGVTFGNERYLPGQTAYVSFTFQNVSDKDLYLYRIGIQPEWSKDTQRWYAQEVRELFKPGQQRFFSFSLPIPSDLSLDEYDIWFGVEGQYLPVTGYLPQITTSWCDPPLLLHVKHPLTRYDLFISHSTSDVQLIRELEKRLDLYGIKATIAEDIPEPGVNLWHKFTSKIQSSTLLLAIMTDDAAKSEWVVKEISYAFQINKPVLFLKEKSLQIQSPVEWVEFSKNDNPDKVFVLIMDALRKMESKGLITNPIAGIIGLGILALLASAFLGGGRK